MLRIRLQAPFSRLGPCAVCTYSVRKAKQPRGQASLSQIWSRSRGFEQGHRLVPCIGIIDFIGQTCSDVSFTHLCFHWSKVMFISCTIGRLHAACIVGAFVYLPWVIPGLPRCVRIALTSFQGLTHVSPQCPACGVGHLGAGTRWTTPLRERWVVVRLTLVRGSPE